MPLELLQNILHKCDKIFVVNLLTMSKISYNAIFLLTQNNFKPTKYI